MVHQMNGCARHSLNQGVRPALLHGFTCHATAPPAPPPPTALPKRSSYHTELRGTGTSHRDTLLHRLHTHLRRRRCQHAGGRPRVDGGGGHTRAGGGGRVAPASHLQACSSSRFARAAVRGHGGAWVPCMTHMGCTRSACTTQCCPRYHHVSSFPPTNLRTFTCSHGQPLASHETTHEQHTNVLPPPATYRRAAAGSQGYHGGHSVG